MPSITQYDRIRPLLYYPVYRLIPGYKEKPKRNYPNWKLEPPLPLNAPSATTPPYHTPHQDRKDTRPEEPG